MKEETGLDVKLIKPISVWSIKKNKVWRIVINYLCEYEKGEVKLSKENSNFAWIKFKDLKKVKLEKWIKENAKIVMKEFKT